MKSFLGIILLSSFTTFASIDYQKEYKSLKLEAKETLNLLDKEIEVLQTRVKKYTGKAKVKVQKEYNHLVSLKDDLTVEINENLQDAKVSSEESWIKIKERFTEISKNIQSKVKQSF